MSEESTGNDVESTTSQSGQNEFTNAATKTSTIFNEQEKEWLKQAEEAFRKKDYECRNFNKNSTDLFFFI